MAVEDPNFPQGPQYPDERFRVTKARDAMRGVLQKFANECHRQPTADANGNPLMGDTLVNARTAYDNIRHWAVHLKRPDEPQKRNEIVECMQLITSLVQNPVLKAELEKMVTEGKDAHREFNDAYNAYANRFTSQGIAVENVTIHKSYLWGLINKAVPGQLTVDFQNKMVIGPKGEDGFDQAVKRAADPDMVGEFNPCQLVPPPPLERLADSDMTGWAQRKRTTTEILKLFEANMPPYKDMMRVMPFLDQDQRDAIHAAMQKYNVRAAEHQQRVASRPMATQANVTNAPDLSAQAGRSAPPDPAATSTSATPLTKTPPASDPSSSSRGGPGAGPGSPR